jgi:HEAT repeat protein
MDSFHIKVWISTAFGVFLALMAGCKPLPKPEFNWPWAKKKPTSSIVTPRDRMEKMRELAKKAPEMSPEEQLKTSVDLAEELRKEEDPLIRCQILRTLAVLPTEPAAAMLRAGAKDTDLDVRIACCNGWAKRKGPEAVQILSEIVSSDTEIDVRLAAARALGEVGDKSAVAALGVALDNSDPAMQYRAAESLAKVSGKHYDNVKDWRDYVKGQTPPEPSLVSRLKKQLF